MSPGGGRLHSRGRLARLPQRGRDELLGRCKDAPALVLELPLPALELRPGVEQPCLLAAGDSRDCPGVRHKLPRPLYPATDAPSPSIKAGARRRRGSAAPAYPLGWYEWASRRSQCRPFAPLSSLPAGGRFPSRGRFHLCGRLHRRGRFHSRGRFHRRGRLHGRGHLDAVAADEVAADAVAADAGAADAGSFVGYALEVFEMMYQTTANCAHDLQDDGEVCDATVCQSCAQFTNMPRCSILLWQHHCC